MIFAFLAETADDKNDDGDDVWQHLGNVLVDRDAEQVGDVLVGPVAKPEDVGSPDQVERPPGGEDDERDGEPAEGFNVARRGRGPFGVAC